MDDAEAPLTSPNWISPTVILCTYGFFKDMKPSEPFLTPYLNSTYKNLDHKDIEDQIYPISTYAYLASLFLVFLLTDFLRYKPLIILESLAYLATRVILVWGNGIFIMQIMQLTYGIASAAEIAYYSYIYTVVDEEYYQRVTSYTRAATLIGRGFSDVLGQILISTDTTNLLVLNYISFGSVCIAVIVCMFLPKVQKSIFLFTEESYIQFEKTDSYENENETVFETTYSIKKCCTQWKITLKKMFIAFKSSYSNKELLMWSLAWALTLCGGLQVEDYVMNLWSTINDGNQEDYNGAVFACGTLLSAVAVFLFSLVKPEWNLIAFALIGLIALLDTVLLFLMAVTKKVLIAYICYVVFRSSYAFTLTVAR